MTANKKGALAGALEQQFSPSHHTPSRTAVALAVLRDAITASGVERFTALAILAAAESYAKARLRDEFAAFAAELDSPREVTA